MMRAAWACFVLLALHAAGASEGLPKPIFYLPLDDGTVAALAGGSPHPRDAVHAEPLLTLLEWQRAKSLAGKVGQCYDVGDSPLVFACAGNFRADEGACSLWLCPHFRGDDTNLYCTFFGAADWGMLYKYVSHTSLTFATAKPGRDLYYDCNVPDIRSWRPGDWHHVVATWSRRENARRIYLDGKLAARAPFPSHREVRDGPLFIGAGCSLYPGHVAHAKLDEVAIWDQPLGDDAVRRLHELGSQGKPLWHVAAPAARAADHARLKLVEPRGPTPPADGPVVTRPTPTREAAPLDGWWHFLPADQFVSDPAADGWGLSRVPGYWTARDDTVGPDGRPAQGRWKGRPLAEFALGRYQRTFTARPEWKAKAVFLSFDGVDGLAEVFLNGERLAVLLPWEPEGYDVGSLLRYGEANTLTVALHRRGGSAIAGVYGRVALLALPQTFIHDVVVQPSVEKGQIRFSCDVWHAGAAAEARLQLGIAPDAEPAAAATQFAHACTLRPADRADRAVSAQLQRIECAFDWKDARLWTYDAPFLYRVVASLRVAGRAADEAPPVRFGFRELALRGSELCLNGKPTHLRGHQIDLAWSDQMARVRELKGAGMNALELSGPVSHSWYTGTPHRGELFEQALDYADEHGLVAVAPLPDAAVLKDRIFEPGAARLYQRRVEKHIRRYGNHPSIGLWFMHFNLAGYRWYIAPSKIDGSYKPSDATFRARERYALEAERLARAIDPRPLYHHACGDLGSIYTLNCYIGPSCPLQEREEWPSRWAAKRPFPLIACEHGCLLIPYWFRPRQFPLSVVYAGEPIFDEIAAMHLGPRAYAVLTPELFDLYDMDRPPRGSRTRAIIQHHAGYQEVKGLFAQHSLRAWRVQGVTGIIFNAVNWDFKDPAGKPLPVMEAMARCFGDTDLYIAGPEGDWPSKDHCFYEGETVRKQIVLLNDLTRDVPCTLEWRLEGMSGFPQASGRAEAVARAGRPTFVPIEFAAPSVEGPRPFRLVANVLSQPGEEFRSESLQIEVFPRLKQMKPNSRILLFDPAGETTKILRREGIAWEPLTEASDLKAHECVVVVGKKSYGEVFVALAKRLGLEQAVAGGTVNLAVFEQTSGGPFGLQLDEVSTRHVFIPEAGHPLLHRLSAEHFVNLRGASDLIEAHPDAPPETERQWPKRFFKWGNRGVVATFAYRKPHYGPFKAVLECGFDLCHSPLLEGWIGRGRVVLCQVDVTSRYGTDPVSTQLARNLLYWGGTGQAWPAVHVGESARAFLAQFGVASEELTPERSGRIVVGTERLEARQAELVLDRARRGATVILLPGGASADAFGLRTREQRLFIGRVGRDRLLDGLGEGDFYLKSWTPVQAVCAENDWRVLVEPGIIAARKLRGGRLITCALDPEKLGPTRGRIKALRVWNTLLTNLGLRRERFEAFLQPAEKLYEPNAWERLPPYINW